MNTASVDFVEPFVEAAIVAIALGSNLGDSHQILTQAIVFLHQSPGIEVIRHSQFYRTAPIGPPQPDYLNACALLKNNKRKWTGFCVKIFLQLTY